MLAKASRTGITRDEISIFNCSGDLDKLHRTHFDLDEAESFVNTIKTRLDTLRKPLMKRELIQDTLWTVSVNEIATRFANMPTNLLILGDKRLTFCYAKHQLATYTTGLQTASYRWNELVSFLEESIKKHATIGAKVHVIHH